LILLKKYPKKLLKEGIFKVKYINFLKILIRSFLI